MPKRLNLLNDHNDLFANLKVVKPLYVTDIKFIVLGCAGDREPFCTAYKREDEMKDQAETMLWHGFHNVRIIFEGHDLVFDTLSNFREFYNKWNKKIGKESNLIQDKELMKKISALTDKYPCAVIKDLKFILLFTHDHLPICKVCFDHEEMIYLVEVFMLNGFNSVRIIFEGHDLVFTDSNQFMSFYNKWNKKIGKESNFYQGE
jgi:hypothetical protein